LNCWIGKVFSRFDVTSKFNMVLVEKIYSSQPATINAFV